MAPWRTFAASTIATLVAAMFENALDSQSVAFSAENRAPPVSSAGQAFPQMLSGQRMPATPADLFAFLDRIGVAHQTVEHPPLFTVEQSRALRGQIPGGHTKNLFLKDKKGVFFLVTTLEDAQITLKTLHHQFGSGRFSFGSPDAMRATLGVEPGSVSPFGAINDTGRAVSIVLDSTMLEHTSLNYHPLVNTMTTTISREGLLRFLEATSHRPRIERISDVI
jgi:Ala-tRNA(Pro) deacylase